MTEDQLRPGVYRHAKDGRFYLLEFVGDVVYENLVKDSTVDILSDGTRIFIVEHEWRIRDNGRHIEGHFLFTARSHGEIAAGARVCIYVPLYADKPGLRRSVRLVSEWIERIEVQEPVMAPVGRFGRIADVGTGYSVKPRFEYVGQTVPQAPDITGILS